MAPGLLVADFRKNVHFKTRLSVFFTDQHLAHCRGARFVHPAGHHLQTHPARSFHTLTGQTPNEAEQTVKIKRIHILLIVLGIAIATIPFRAQVRRPVVAVVQILKGRKTVTDRLAEFGPAARRRLAPDFKRTGVSYPPKQLIFVGLKQEKTLEVWASPPLKLLKTYPILGTSGTLGPKLREGDLQIPEGVYKIESLNPNSLYHLALRLDYPNPFDQARGKTDGRKNLGGDIMIHGKNCSVGCLAMGDEAIEELFVLSAETGTENIKVILSPVDFRIRERPDNLTGLPDWAPDLYVLIKNELRKVK